MTNDDFKPVPGFRMMPDGLLDAIRAHKARQAAEQADPSLAVDPSWSTPDAVAVPAAVSPTTSETSDAD